MFKSKIALFLLLTAPVFMSAPMCSFANTPSTHETASEAVKSTAITTDIKAKLLADPDIKSFTIAVKTVNGVVTLTGTVDTSAQKTKAVGIATKTDGVKSVNDKLVIKKVKK